MQLIQNETCVENCCPFSGVFQDHERLDVVTTNAAHTVSSFIYTMLCNVQISFLKITSKYSAEVFYIINIYMTMSLYLLSQHCVFYF
jgi:hypothetical protein